MKKELDDIMESMNKEIRSSLIANGVNADSVIEEFASILFGDDTRSADKIRCIELFTKWGGYNAVEKKEFDLRNGSGVNIVIKAPEDFMP